MFEDLDTVDWAALSHADGPAVDAPDALRALASEDPNERAQAHRYLAAVRGTIYSVTPHVLPFLTRLAADPAVPERSLILDFLAAVAWVASHQGEDDEVDEDDEEEREDPEWSALEREHAAQCAAELATGYPIYHSLLDDPDPLLRVTAGRLVARLLRLIPIYPAEAGARLDATRLVDALRDRLARDVEPLARASLLAALGEAAADLPELRADLRANLGPEQHPGSRMAAVEALVELGEPEDAATTAALVAAAIHWRRVVPTGDDFALESLYDAYRPGLTQRLQDASRRDADAVLLPLLEALGDGDADARRNAARTLGEIPMPAGFWAEGRTDPAGALTSRVVQALHDARADSDPVVRTRAAEALLDLGLGGTAEVEILIEALEGADPEATSDAVGALTKAGPAAAPAVPALIARLEAELEQRDPNAARVPAFDLAQDLRSFWKTEQVRRLRLLRALSAIGPAAAPAAPLLMRLLDDPAWRIASAALNALCAVTPRSPDLLPLLLQALEGSSDQIESRDAVQALAQFGPETQGVVEALAKALQASVAPEAAARALGQMGRGAVAALPALREAFEQESGWVRAHIGRVLTRIAAADEAIPFLIEMLEGDYPAISTALDELQTRPVEALPAVPAILNCLTQEEERSLQTMALRTLAHLGPEIGPEAIGRITDRLTDPYPETALSTLTRLGPEIGPEAVARITGLLTDPHPGTALEAALALRELGLARDAWLPALLRLAELQPDGEADETKRWGAGQARVRAAETLWQAGERPPSALEAVLEGLHDPDNVYWAARALLELGAEGAPAIPRLRELLADREDLGEIRMWVAGALWALGERDPELLDILTKALSTTNGREWTAYEILGRLGPAAAPAIPALIIASEGRGRYPDSADHRQHVLEALAKVRGEPAATP